MARLATLQKEREFIHSQACLPDNSAQRPSVQFAMIRNHQLGKGLIPSQNNMAALLPPGVEADFCQRANALPP